MQECVVLLKVVPSGGLAGPQTNLQQDVQRGQIGRIKEARGYSACLKR